MRTKVKLAIWISLCLLGALSVIFLSQDQDNLIPKVGFFVLVISSLIIYQSFAPFIRDTAIANLLFFLGRLIFCGLIIFTTATIMTFYRKMVIRESSLQMRPTIDSITTVFRRGRIDYAHYSYEVSGKRVHKQLMLSRNHTTKVGDTVYLSVSKTNPNFAEIKRISIQY